MVPSYFAAYNVSMNNLGGGDFDLNITVPQNATHLHYRVIANDTSNNWNSTTQTTLTVNDTIAPEIVDSTIGEPITGKSLSFMADIDDNIAVEHVQLYEIGRAHV